MHAHCDHKWGHWVLQGEGGGGSLNPASARPLSPAEGSLSPAGGHWALQRGHWVLQRGHWVLQRGHWVLEGGWRVAKSSDTVPPPSWCQHSKKWVVVFKCVLCSWQLKATFAKVMHSWAWKTRSRPGKHLRKLWSWIHTTPWVHACISSLDAAVSLISKY